MFRFSTILRYMGGFKLNKLFKKGVMLLIFSLVICLIKPIPVNAASFTYLSKKHGSLDTFEKVTYTFNVPYKSEIDINFIGFGSKQYEMTFGSFLLTIKNAKGKDVFLSAEHVK